MERKPRRTKRDGVGFAEWRGRVDALLGTFAGCGLDDLGDWREREAWEEGLTPADAAREAFEWSGGARGRVSTGAAALRMTGAGPSREFPRLMSAGATPAAYAEYEAAPVETDTV